MCFRNVAFDDAEVIERNFNAASIFLITLLEYVAIKDVLSAELSEIDIH